MVYHFCGVEVSLFFGGGGTFGKVAVEETGLRVRSDSQFL